MSRKGRGEGRRAALRALGGGALVALAAGSGPVVAIAGQGDGKAPAVIGVATYEVGADGTLDGVWTIESYAGRLGTERASGGTPGRLPGTYAVAIHNPDGIQVFEGTLKLEALGAAYRMTWSGVDGTRYAGLGLRRDQGPLSAVYWGPVM
jgi:hypothetical protein